LQKLTSLGAPWLARLQYQGGQLSSRIGQVEGGL
jgi:hypothetical protein